MEPIFRPAEAGDLLPAYRVFRRSLFAYLHRTGQATAEEAADPPVESSWMRQEDWVRHLWDTACENWVATGSGGEILGWALSVERSGHLELAFFFVDPASSARGVGTRLLDLAFAARPETARTIMATQDPAGLSLYLRSGVGFVASSFDICVTARATAPGTDLVLRRLTADPADIAMVAAIEGQLLGLRREVDLHFLVGNRPGWIAFRNDVPVGYAFGAEPLPAGATDRPPTIGPAAALDDADLPALIDQIIGAAPAGCDLYFGVPMTNRRAIAHLLGMGGKIDPFFLAVLSTESRMQLDRYLHTAPSFII